MGNRNFHGNEGLFAESRAFAEMGNYSRKRRATSGVASLHGNRNFHGKRGLFAESRAFTGTATFTVTGAIRGIASLYGNGNNFTGPGVRFTPRELTRNLGLFKEQASAAATCGKGGLAFSAWLTWGKESWSPSPRAGEGQWRFERSPARPMWGKGGLTFPGSADAGERRLGVPRLGRCGAKEARHPPPGQPAAKEAGQPTTKEACAFLRPAGAGKNEFTSSSRTTSRPAAANRRGTAGYPARCRWRPR
ncbi:hypothetical protein IJ21_45060 [Paenibacillus sp. 32O-W]|nr:hypothetical protein IJ21_45060 [Paenibacillus sp. 32O-W]